MAFAALIPGHLSPDMAAALRDTLNARLADAIATALQLKQAHWNVRGGTFQQLHELFDTTYAQVVVQGDTLAERVVQLGGVAHGTVQTVAVATVVAPMSESQLAPEEYVRATVDALRTFGASMYKLIDEAEKLGDPVTADIATGIAREVDKAAWFIGAHLG